MADEISEHPAWVTRGADQAAELTRRASSLRRQLGLVERECANMRSQLSQRRAQHRMGPQPGDVADELMLAAAAAQRRLDGVERECDDVVIKARRIAQHTSASAAPDRLSEIAVELSREAASVRSRLDAVEREHIGLRAQLDRLVRRERLRPPSAPDPESLLTDVAGYDDLRPDPLRARSASQYMAALRQFRIWSGEPSLRTMSARSGKPASTLSAALNGTALPPLDTVTAIITACNGGTEDRRQFITAWRQIRLARPFSDAQAEEARRRRAPTVPGSF